MIDFNLNHTEDYAIVTFELQEQGITPATLRDLSPPDPIKENFAHKGVVLSGRGPVWLFGFLIHYYHPTKFVATYDPRLEGAVVVESHGSECVPGDIIPIDIIDLNLSTKSKKRP
jgi:CRISPR-associated protein Csx3